MYHYHSKRAHESGQVRTSSSSSSLTSSKRTSLGVAGATLKKVSAGPSRSGDSEPRTSGGSGASGASGLGASSPAHQGKAVPVRGKHFDYYWARAKLLAPRSNSTERVRAQAHAAGGPAMPQTEGRPSSAFGSKRAEASDPRFRGFRSKARPRSAVQRGHPGLGDRASQSQRDSFRRTSALAQPRKGGAVGGSSGSKRGSSSVHATNLELMQKNEVLRKELERLRQQRGKGAKQGTSTSGAKVSIAMSEDDDAESKASNESDEPSSATAVALAQAARAKAQLHSKQAAALAAAGARPTSAVARRSTVEVRTRPESAHFSKRAPRTATSSSSNSNNSNNNNISSSSSKNSTTRMPSSGGHPQSYRSNHPTASTSNSTSTTSTPSASKGGASAGHEGQQKERDRIRSLVSSPDFSTGRPDLYVFGKLLGQGSFGTVRAAHHKITGHKVAIKVYERAKFKDANQQKRCQVELKLMETLDHINIVRLFEAFETPKRMYLIMEACNGGNLCTYVKARKRLSEAESLRIVLQITQGLEYLHANQIVHRDIKLENILLLSNGVSGSGGSGGSGSGSGSGSGFDVVKICDLGFSTRITHDMKLKVFCGTPSYMPPEIVRRKEYTGTGAVDVWSLGVLFYACLVGRFPFTAKTYPELYKKIARGVFNPLPDSVSTSSKHLIRKTLSLNAAMRPSSAQLRRTLLADHKELAAVSARCASDAAASGAAAWDLDEEVSPTLVKQLADFGFKEPRLRDSLKNKRRNHLTATYFLLASKALKKKQQQSNKK